MRYSGNLTVRDNDVGWDEMKADEEDDAPTVAAVIDERPEELRIVLFFVHGILETHPGFWPRLIGPDVKIKLKKAKTRWLESNRKRQITKT